MVIQAPDNPNNILVVNERGDLKSMPMELAQDLEGTGFVPAEQEHIDLLKEHQEQRKFMETPGQQVASAAMGALSGLTIGAAPWVMGKTLGAIGGEESEEAFREWQRQQEEFNPGLKLGGEIAGALLPAALTGGGSLALSGAQAGVRGASVLGKVGSALRTTGGALSLTPTGAAVGLGRLAERKIAEKVGEGLFGITLKPAAAEVAGIAAGNTVEGMLFGLGSSVSKQYLENDPNLTAEAYTMNLLKDAGIGGLVGAAVPTALHGGTAAIREARRLIDPITDALAKSGKETFKKVYMPLAAFRTDANIKDIDAMFKPLAPSKEWAQKLGVEDELKSIDDKIKDLFDVSDIEDDALDIIENKKPAADFNEYQAERRQFGVIRKVEKIKANVASLNNSDVSKLVTRFDEELMKQADLVDNFRADVSGGLLGGTGGRVADFPQLQQALAQYDDAVKNMRAEFIDKNKFDRNKFRDFIKDPYSDRFEVEKIAYDKLNESTFNLVKVIGPETRTGFGWQSAKDILDSVDLNETITDLLAKKSVFDNLPVSAKKELGLTEVIAGGTSLIGATSFTGPMMKALAISRAAQIGKDPAKDIAQWAAIQNGIQAVKDEVGLFGKHFAMPAAVKITEFGPAVAATTQTLQNSWDAKKRGRKRKEDELTAFREYMTSLQGLTREPDVLKETINQQLAGLNDLPMSREAAAQQLLIVSDYLTQKLPSLKMTDDVDLDRLALPSKDELRQFRRMVETINNPLKVVRQMGQGKVTLEGVQTLRDIYPRIYQDLTQEVMRLVKAKKLNSPQQREQARLILGISDSDLFMLQQAFEPEEPQPEPRPKGRKVGEGAVKRLIEAQQTPLQKIQ